MFLLDSAADPRQTLVYAERRRFPRSADAGQPAPGRIHRERDFGVGYGSSSGYGSNRRYAVASGSYFRCR
ncbi:hypothetical protein [Thermomonas flagellata]|uniref:hypothetical protein n=1 Tax=Thermomonas flagellata TaxID=2888524 RepID=UPI001F0504FD|nr:hypothetical protein [Thermomonas flagellata]